MGATYIGNESFKKGFFNISLIIIIISISTLIMGIANLQLEYSQLLSLTQEYCENLK